MADTKKTVELEIIANAEQVPRELDKIARKSEEIGKIDAKYGKLATKHEKELSKFDEKRNDPRKQKKAADNLKSATRQEKERLRILERQNKELQKYYSTQQRIAAGAATGAPGGPRGRGPAAQQAGGGGGSQMALLQGISGAIAGAVVAAAGIAVGTVSRQISAGFDQYVEFGKAQIGLAGMGASSAALNDLRRRSASQFAYTGVETMEQAAQVGRATGQYQGVTSAQAMTRGTALNMGESVAFMQTLTQAGTGFGGRAGRQGFKELSKAVALGTNAGMDEARLPEFIQGVQKVVQLQAGRQGGDVMMSQYARVLQAMGQYGGTGLQGARGGAVFQRLNEAIVRPGGGEAGQAAMMQAMGFGIPGGSATYYEALRRQEQGATAENIRDLFRVTEAQYGGGEEQVLALREMTGLSITQLEEMRGVVEKMSGTEREDKLKELIDAAASPEERAAKELAEIGEVQRQSVEFQDRLVEIGRDSYQGIVNLQIAINKMVDQLLPLALTALEAIAKAATHIANIMGGGISYNPNEGVKAIGGMKVAGAAPGGMVGEFDPAFVAGQRDLDRNRRQAINEIIASNPEAKRMGGRSLQDVYRQMTSGERGAPSPKNQELMFEKLFGAGGEFEAMLEAKLSQMADAATSAADSAAETNRLFNSGAATQAVPTQPMIYR